MKKETGQKGKFALLVICYLSRMVIGSSQPFGVQPAALICIVAAGTLLQLAVIGWLKGLQPPANRVMCGLLTLCLSITAAYDFIKADRFYRGVTSQHFVFWWLTAGMVLFGWYAAFCGFAAVQRMAKPVYLLMMLSLIILALTGDYTRQNLPVVTPDKENTVQTVNLLLQYTFSGEELLWVCWQQDGFGENIKKTVPPLRKAMLIRTVFIVIFSLLGGMALGEGFATTPQIFGRLSLQSGGQNAAYTGVLYHTVWLAALAVRVGVICCTVKDLVRKSLPDCPARIRFGLVSGVILAGCIYWNNSWQQDGTRLLTVATVMLLIMMTLTQKKGRSRIK